MRRRLQMMGMAVILSLSLLAGCGNQGANGDTQNPTESQVESETNTETEKESQTETDASTEVESETSTESESESQTESESESEQESEADKQPESDKKPEEDKQPESEQKPEEDKQPESDKKPEADKQPESEKESESEKVPAHTHKYTEKITKTATCEAKGVKTYTCSCGDSYTKDIKATGHSFGEYKYNNDATQSKDGTKTRTCSACGKKETKTAEGTKLPTDPYSLKAVNSLNDIKSVGTMTDADSSIYYTVLENIKAGKYEKVRFIAANGDQFCMWNVRIKDERLQDESGITTYYWFLAPINEKFSDGNKYCNESGTDATSVEKRMTTLCRYVSSPTNESWINDTTNVPDAYREINTKDCPVELYKIEEVDDKMMYVWVESTNCYQEGIGTCGGRSIVKFNFVSILRNHLTSSAV